MVHLLKIKNILVRVLFLFIFLLILFIAISLVFTLFYPMKYKEYINKYSREYDLDPFLVAAIINVESKYNKNATSHKDARGLMQIGKQTGQWASEEFKMEDYNVNILFDPETNIKMGTWYLDKLNIEFEDNLDLVLAAYNAGSGNVTKWLKDDKYSKDGKNLHHIPFSETKDYLKKVKFNQKIYETIYKSYMTDSNKMITLYFDAINHFRDYLRDV